MKKESIFLMISILGVACFVFTGYFIAERSPWGIVLSLIGAFVIIGVGFSLKRVWNN